MAVSDWIGLMVLCISSDHCHTTEVLNINN